jgi:4-hydroxy-3-methylbut-2-enyl diphosphate reductase
MRMLQTDSCPAQASSQQPIADTPILDVLLVAPRGFCAGVHRAIQAVEDALRRNGAPVYVRRPIVHNMEVLRSLEAKGAVFVEELDEVPDGAVVVFSAHGIAPAIRHEAERRNLRSHDAVCPLVAKVHRQVERHQRAGRTTVLIGHEGHPEIEGTLGRLREGSAFVVKDVPGVRMLPIRPDAPVSYAIQTTFSVTDAEMIITALRDTFSDLEEPATSDICYATTNRQKAIAAAASSVDAVIVVGERFSSNACRLAEVAATACCSVQLAASSAELDWAPLVDARSIAITAAASTPESSVQSVVEALGRRFRLRLTEEEAVEHMQFKPLLVA